MDQNTRQIHKGGSPSICGQQNSMATAIDLRGQKTKDTFLPSPKIVINYATMTV